MKYLIFSVLLSLLVIAMIGLWRSINRLSNTQKMIKEVELIITSMLSADTLSELEFWENEARSLLTRYDKKVFPDHLNVSARHLGYAYKQRFNKGFNKGI